MYVVTVQIIMKSPIIQNLGRIRVPFQNRIVVQNACNARTVCKPNPSESRKQHLPGNPSFE